MPSGPTSKRMRFTTAKVVSKKKKRGAQTLVIESRNRGGSKTCNVEFAFLPGTEPFLQGLRGPEELEIEIAVKVVNPGNPA